MYRRLRFHKSWFVKTALVILVIFSLMGGTTRSNAEAPPSKTDPPQEIIPLPEDARSWTPELSQRDLRGNKNPKLDSVLSQLVSAVDDASRQSLIESQALRVSDGQVQVQISTSSENLEGAVAAVEGAGGRVTKTSEAWSLIQAWLPIETLESTAGQTAILYIRAPQTITPLEMLNAGSQTTEGLAAINGDAWHSAGYDGGGVKVGIIDGGFQGYSSLLGTDLPASVDVENFVDGEGDPQVDGTTKHGTACAEVIYDIAPGASLYLVKINTLLDLVEAITWLKDVQSVDIISTSLALYNISPGDGTGILEDLVSDARSAGITWITGAGNDREVHWGGAYNDPGGNDSHFYTTESNINVFGPGDGTAFGIPTGYPISIFLRWDDWTAVNQDYDLYLLRWTGSTWETVAYSENFQEGIAGQFPTESINFVTTDPTSVYSFMITRWDSNRNVNLEVFAPNMLHLNYYVYDRSLANLADAESVMTVSALDVNSPYDQEPYSSQGPTNGPGGTAAGGFTKPDIAGFANVSTVSYGTTDKFSGTSSATPHVAGAAALVLTAFPAYTPDQLQTFLEDRALEMGTAGMDNIYGHGRLYLGDPPTTVTGPIVNSITPNTGENTGSIPVSISGSNFETGATVKLTKAGQPDINASSVNVNSPTQIFCNLNLTGAATGAWNVVVTNPDEESGTLTNGFTIYSPQTGSNIYLPLIFKALEPPTLNVINNADGDGSYTVSWSSASGASSYILQEDDNQAFSSPKEVYDGTATSKAISGRDKDRYYYRVKAIAGSMSSGWSNIRSVLVTEELPDNIGFQIGESNAVYYVYSSGRSFNATAPSDYPVTQVQTISYLASSQPVIFNISIKHNGTTVASWSISVNHEDFREYTRTKNVSFDIEAGDTLTYYISSNTSSTSAAVHGVSAAVFYK